MRRPQPQKRKTFGSARVRGSLRVDGGLHVFGGMSVEGENGPVFIVGPSGPQGIPGADSVVPGPPGADSVVPGPQGPQGDPGVDGADGADSVVPGPEGPQGDQGIQGEQGASGVGARGSATPADPAVTSSTTGVMMGLAASITPTLNGTLMIQVVGDSDNSIKGDGCKMQIRTGTGGAPGNGAALTGTAGGSAVQSLEASATNGMGRHPFCLVALVTGLAVGVAVWVDVSLAAVTAGNARIRNCSIVLVEF